MMESFGNNRYLVYLTCGLNEQSMWAELLAMLSRKFGVPQNRMELRRDIGADKIFMIG